MERRVFLNCQPNSGCEAIGGVKALPRRAASEQRLQAQRWIQSRFESNMQILFAVVKAFPGLVTCRQAEVVLLVSRQSICAKG